MRHKLTIVVAELLSIVGQRELGKKAPLYYIKEAGAIRYT